MCILCVIQKWSRRVATMLPWLVIPVIVLWALSQLLPPPFRFEVTPPRLACVMVLLITLLWYEILMPQLTIWTARRNSRLRERKRFEAIEMQKLRKTAMRKCRNCLTPYKDQNPGGGKFMCSYCGHISKRPVLDLPVPPGMGLSNSGILKDLVGKGGKILNGKVWSDNGWMCGQDWLENGNWVGGSFDGKSSYWRNGGGFFSGDDHCLAEKSYSCVFVFACKAFMAFILSIRWLWRKVFRVSSADASTDAGRRGELDKRGDNAGNCLESKGEKARRKAEEKRQARLERELLEEEERKQREEVARLVEERRRLRDEKMEAEKEHGKGSPTAKERDSKREPEKKLQERKKERDRASSKSNSDAEELEKKAVNRKSENDRREHHRTGVENVKVHGTDLGHGYKSAAVSNHGRGNAGNRYFDRVKGTFLYSSRAFTGGGFFGKDTNVSGVPREHKPNTSVDHCQTSANRRELSQSDRATGKSYVNGDDNKNSINRPVFIEPQPCTAPKKSWQQLFTRSSAVSPPSNSNVISRPSGKSQSEVQSPPFPGLPPSIQVFDSPVNVGLSSPFSLPSFSFQSTSNSTGLPLSSEAMFPRLGETPAQFLPEESEIFEDPCYDPDPVSLLGPVSESLDNFQLDLGFVGDIGLEKPCAMKSIHVPSEVNRPSPIESPMSRARVPEERHPTSFLFPSTPKAHDMRQPVDGSSNANERGTWQMWSSSPLGPDSLGLLGGSASWFLPTELNGSTNKEDTKQPVAHKTMASLFSKDDQGISGARSPQKAFLGNCQNGGMLSSVPVSAEDPWLSKTFIGPTPGSENQFPCNLTEEVTQNGTVYGSPRASAANNQFDMSTANPWGKKDHSVQGSGDGIGNSSMIRPPIGGLYSTQDVQSVWSV